MRRVLLLAVLLLAVAPVSAQTGLAGRTLTIGPTPTPPDSSTSVRITGLAGSGTGLPIWSESDGDVFRRAIGKSDLPSVTVFTDQANTFGAFTQSFGGAIAGTSATFSSTLGISGLTTAAKIRTTGIYAVSAPLLFRNAADSATVLSMADAGLSITGTLGVSGATTLSSTLGVTGAATLSSTLGVTGLSTLTGGFAAGAASTVNSTLGITGLTTAALIRTTGTYGVSEPWRVLATDGTTDRLLVHNAGKATLTDTGNDSYLLFTATGNPSGQRNWRVGNIGGSLLLQGGDDAGSTWTSLFRTTQTAGVPDGWYWGTGMLTVSPDTNMGTNLGEINKLYANLRVANLWANTLVAYDTITTIPGNVLIGPTTQLTADIDDDDTTIVVDHNEMASGDIVYLQAGGGTEFMQMASGPTSVGGSTLSLVGSASNTGATSITLPTHVAGDLIVIIAWRTASSAIPALGGSFTSLGGTCATNGNSTGVRVGYLVATGGSETSGTWTNATALIAYVFRGWDGVTTPLCDSLGNSGSSTLRYPALTLTGTEGRSWVIRSASGNNATATTTPSGYTLDQEVGSAPRAWSHRLESATSHPTQLNTTVNASGAQRALTLEIRGGTGVGPYSYTVTRGYGGVFAGRPWLKGAALFNTGTTGDCHLQAFAIQSIKGTGEAGPTIQGNCRTGTGYNAWSTNWVLGNLANMYTYGPTPTFGAAFGDAADVWVGIDATNGFRAFEGGTNEKVRVDPTGFVRIGQSGSGQANTYIDNTALKLRRGTVDYVDLSSSGLTMSDGTNVRATLDATNGLVLGRVAANHGNTVIDTSGNIRLRSNTTDRITLGASNGNIDLLDDDGTTVRARIGASAAYFGSTNAARFQVDYGAQLRAYDHTNKQYLQIDATNGVLLGDWYTANKGFMQIHPAGDWLAFCRNAGSSCPLNFNGVTGDVSTFGNIYLGSGGNIESAGEWSFARGFGLRMGSASSDSDMARSISWPGNSFIHEHAADDLHILTPTFLTIETEDATHTFGESQITLFQGSVGASVLRPHADNSTTIGDSTHRLANLHINLPNDTGAGYVVVGNSSVDSTRLAYLAGFTGTKTVRNSAGSGTCTLVFQTGILTGGTC